MEWILIRQVSEYLDKNVKLRGWVSHIRSSGKIIFIELRDGTGYIQCVAVKNEIDENKFLEIEKLTLESSIEVKGVIRRDNRSKIGYEIGISDIVIIQKPIEEFPISTKEHGVAFLMDKRHLWLRSSRQNAILKIRATIIKSIRDFLDSQGFIVFDTPIFTPSVCEGTTNLFETSYFDDKAYLTQSGQLYNEAGAMSLGKVYSFGPTFRAEKSKTRRHLTEFWMVEPEAAFFELFDMIDLSQKFVANIVAEVLKNNRAELEILERDISFLENISLPFPVITYDNAIDILKSKGYDVSWGDDFGGDEETIISEKFNNPVLIIKYPKECKAFYMKDDPERKDTVLNFDMIAPEGYGEIIGGGQREDDYDILLSKIKKQNLEVDSFDWYLDLRKYGTVPHAGFGLGIERTVSWLCGLKHVRETIPFPRLMDRLKP